MKEMYEESLRLIKILKLKTEDEYNKLVKEFKVHITKT